MDALKPQGKLNQGVTGKDAPGGVVPPAPPGATLSKSNTLPSRPKTRPSFTRQPTPHPLQGPSGQLFAALPEGHGHFSVTIFFWHQKSNDRFPLLNCSIVISASKEIGNIFNIRNASKTDVA